MENGLYYYCLLACKFVFYFTKYTKAQIVKK